MTGEWNRPRSGAPRTEWPTVLLIAGCYGAWAVSGHLLWPGFPAVAFILLTLSIALHSSLMHEASHGHPTRNAPVNEFLVGFPVGLVYPYRRFKTLHLRHHADERLTDPFDDPESYYRALWKHEELPAWLRGLLRINNSMVGRFLIGPAIANAGFLITDAKLLATGDRAIRRAWLHHAIGLAVLLPVILFAFEIPLWVYLAAAYFGQSFIAIRTFAEHQWSELPDGRTIIVERSPLALLFLNNNLHLVHHKMPTVAWYELPRLFRERREEWIRLNGDYSYPNYFALLKDFAFRPKEPVVHPALRRAPEPGRAFRPRVRARTTSPASAPRQCRQSLRKNEFSASGSPCSDKC